MDENYIFSRWSPWRDVQIATWQIPFGEWHLRLHRINSTRTLQTVEGGFAVMKTAHQVRERGCYLLAENGSSVIVDLSPIIQRSQTASSRRRTAALCLRSAPPFRC